MYAYVKFDNGYFGTVLISQIPHYESPYDKFKKYKVVVDDIPRDAIIIYTAETEELLNKVIENHRTKVPPSALLKSASDLSGTELEKNKVEETELLEEQKQKSIKILNDKLGKFISPEILNVNSNKDKKSKLNKRRKTESQNSSKVKSTDNSVKKIKKEKHDSPRKNEPCKKRKSSTDDSNVLKKSPKMNKKPIKLSKNAEDNISLKDTSTDSNNVPKQMLVEQNEALHERNKDSLGFTFTNVIDNTVPEKIFDDFPAIDPVDHVTNNPVDNSKTKNRASSSNSNNEDLTENNHSKNKKKVKKSKNKKNKTHDRHDSTKEIANLKSKIKVLESRLKQMEDERNVERKLNIDLQTKILNKMDEYATRQLNPFSTVGLTDVSLGHINQDARKIHCGNGYHMCYDRYLDAVNKASSVCSTNNSNKRYTSFVKSVAVTIVGLETLKNCSVKGRRCNRFEGSLPKPAIPPEKLKAIYGIFEHYLRSEVRLDPVQTELELSHVSSYIASKIQDLNRKPRTLSKGNKELQKGDKACAKEKGKDETTNEKTKNEGTKNKETNESDSKDEEKKSESGDSESGESESGESESEGSKSEGSNTESERIDRKDEKSEDDTQ